MARSHAILALLLAQVLAASTLTFTLAPPPPAGPSAALAPLQQLLEQLQSVQVRQQGQLEGQLQLQERLAALEGRLVAQGRQGEAIASLQQGQAVMAEQVRRMGRIVQVLGLLALSNHLFPDQMTADLTMKGTHVGALNLVAAGGPAEVLSMETAPAPGPAALRQQLQQLLKGFAPEAAVTGAPAEQSAQPTQQELLQRVRQAQEDLYRQQQT